MLMAQLRVFNERVTSKDPPGSPKFVPPGFRETLGKGGVFLVSANNGQGIVSSNDRKQSSR